MKNFFLMILSFCPIGLQAQMAPGSWRLHLPFNQAIGLEENGEAIEVASSSGIFKFDRRDGGIEILNKVNGLSDVGISAYCRHPRRDLAIIGYENGNVDLLKGNSIKNLTEIIKSTIPGSKRINRIHFSGNLAYLSCDLGIVVYNVDREEVRESNITMGAGGKTIQVRDCLKFADTLYAVTQEGLKKIAANQPLKNTELWKKIGPESGIPPNPVDLLTLDSLGENQLVLGTLAGLHYRTNGGFPLTTYLGGRIFSVRKKQGQVLVSIEDNVVILDENGQNLIRVLDPEYFKKISRPSDAILDRNGVYWISDFENGMLRITQSDTSRIIPNGPLFSQSFSLSNYKNKVVLHAGGYTYPTGNYSNDLTGGFAIFSDGEWQTYNQQTLPSIPLTKDIVHSFFDTKEQKLYLSSFGYGILTRTENNEFFLINDSTTNGGLCNIFIPDCIYNAGNPAEAGLGRTYIRITSSCRDQQGNLWATCFNNTRGSVRYQSSRDNSWKTVTLPSGNDEFPMQIISDQLNQKWVRMAPGRQSDDAAIWVLDSTGNRKLRLTSDPASGGLPANDIYDIHEDKTGYIWVGTSKGLAVFYNPVNAFFQNGITASTPIFPPEAGRPVLENDVVTSIETDGANRKWVGTKDNGVWLFNEDISQVIQQFNTSNSPLVSNYIYDIVVNKATGEVFFATDKGLVSFQGDATENLDQNGNVRPVSCEEKNIKIFPNPVPRNFDGVIAVQGLAANAEIKILTPSGKLVFQTNGRGSMATWNGLTYEGKKVPPGIYMLVSSGADGLNACTSKIAILD
jgi:hypothetical protein